VPLTSAAFLAAAIAWQIDALLHAAQARQVGQVFAHGQAAFFITVIGVSLFGICMAAMLRSAALRLRGAHAATAHVATHDRLTGLPNRALLDDRIAQSIAHARRNEHWVGVLFIDLDGFKTVNDTLGHAAGDDLLVKFSRRLVEAVRGGDTVARIGGDEFVVVADDLQEWEHVRVIADKLVRAVAGPLGGRDGRRGISASVGVSLYPSDGDKPAALVHRADVAMYHAKLAGGGVFRLFRDLPESAAANG